MLRQSGRLARGPPGARILWTAANLAICSCVLTPTHGGPAMSITQEHDVLKNERLLRRVAELTGFVQQSFQAGTAIHTIELGVWERLLQMGHDCVDQVFAMAGTGDMGERALCQTASNASGSMNCTSDATCRSLAYLSCGAWPTAAARARRSTSSR